MAVVLTEIQKKHDLLLMQNPNKGNKSRLFVYVVKNLRFIPCKINENCFDFAQILELQPYSCLHKQKLCDFITGCQKYNQHLS